MATGMLCAGDCDVPQLWMRKKETMLLSGQCTMSLVAAKPYLHPKIDWCNHVTQDIVAVEGAAAAVWGWYRSQTRPLA